MPNIEILCDRRTSYGECDYDDPWDRPDSYTENYVKGFKVTENGS